MFRLISDLSDSPHTVSYETIEDAFHPLKNKLWAQGYTQDGYWTLETIQRMCKSVWTHENIRENSKYFLTYESMEYDLNTHLAARDILLALPEHLLWILEWIHIATVGYDHVTFFDYRPEEAIHDTDPSPLFHFKPARIIKTLGYQTDYTNFMSRLIEKLTTLESSMSSFFSHYRSHNLSVGCRWWYNGQAAAFLAYAYDRSICSLNDRDVRPSMIPCGGEADNLKITLKVASGYGALPLIIYSPLVSKTYKEPLKQVKAYSFDVRSILPSTLKTEGEYSPIFYGTELELTTDYTESQLIDATNEPFFCIKGDSSISGSKKNAFELVTTPMSLKSHKLEWGYWFQKLDMKHFDTSLKTTNGMHIHIGRDSFGVGSEYERHLKNFCWFLSTPAHQAFILDMSERGSLAAMHQYARPPNYGTAVTPRQAYQMTTDLLSARRGSINMPGKKATVEVRLFRGIVSFNSVIKNLEFTDSVFVFTKDLKFQTNTLTNYIAWLQKQPSNKYRILRETLKEINVNTHLLLAEMQNLIFNETDPDRILSILKKAHFPATNQHVTLLNKKAGKRVFIYDKVTQKILRIPEKGGLLAKRDDEMLAMYARQVTRVPPEPQSQPYVPLYPQVPSALARHVARQLAPGELSSSDLYDTLNNNRRTA